MYIYICTGSLKIEAEALSDVSYPNVVWIGCELKL